MKQIYIKPNVKAIIPVIDELMGKGVVGSEQTSNPEDWNSNDSFFEDDANEEQGTTINVWDETL